MRSRRSGLDMSEEEEAPPTSLHLSRQMKEEERWLELSTSWWCEGGGAVQLEEKSKPPVVVLGLPLL
jgi:hypothetical protein